MSKTKKGGGNVYTELELIEENGDTHYKIAGLKKFYLSSDEIHFIKCTYDVNKRAFVSRDGEIEVDLMDTPDFSQYKVYTLGLKSPSKSKSKSRSKSKSKSRSKSRRYGTRV